LSKSLENRRTGSSFLEQVRSKIIEAYTPERIEKKVSEMWDAKDVRSDKNGEKYETPNWKAQDAALKTVLQIQGMEMGEEKQQRVAPTKITVIVNGNTAVVKDEKVIEAVVVKEEKPNV
jgi:hypothetical protein